METSAQFANSESEPAAAVDVIELSKQGCFTILLDEHPRGLEAGLEDDGFKAWCHRRGKPMKI